MKVARVFTMIEGNLSTRRSDVVSLMAADLIKHDAVGNENDAIRVLMWGGRYNAFDVALMVDDARQVAMQDVVAREMSKS